MSRTVLLPIIAVIALAIQAITGHEIAQDMQDNLADALVIVISFIIAIVGVFKDFTSKRKAKEKNANNNGDGI